MQHLLEKLDYQQREAVLHTHGPILVLAGAGSGKTRVLTYRIARLVLEKHCAADQILAVTFTNKAAREMQNRIADLLTPKIAQAMTIATFHSFGARILRDHGTLMNIGSNFTIIDDSDRVSTLKSVMRLCGKTAKKEDYAEYGTSISLAKNGSLDPEQFKEKNPDQLRTIRIYKAYTAALLKRQSVDFDDLLLLPLKILRSNPTLVTAYRKKYTFIAVDEFQDTNATQMALTQILAAPANNLMVVGDDDQSIYSWRGAEIDNILSFPSQFKGCKVVILDKNYRSTPAIVDAASHLISHNQKRKLKKVIAVSRESTPIITFKADDEAEEMAWIIQMIQENQSNNLFSLNDHALLFRTNTLIAKFEEEFRIQRIPYKVQGAMSFYERKEVKDVIAYLRFFANTHDELSLERILKVPNKGITASSLEKIEELAMLRKISLWEAFEQFADCTGIEPNQQEKIGSLVNFYKKYAAAFHLGHLSQTFIDMLAECGYKELLKQSYKNEPSLQFRLENIEQIEQSLASYEKRRAAGLPTLAGYLHECALISNDEEDDTKPKKGVTLMTLHKAKGLEFPV
ncbi:MAG: UvrD-helicase domain-containing protein, partial [Chitinivibrionales bacterium]|nr:UvrD-helicase domain-containing protein [Chitinivibrionales bacterium]